MSDNKNTANYCKHSKKSFTMAKKKHILVPTFEENKIIRLEVVFIQSIFKKNYQKINNKNYAPLKILAT